MTGLAAASASGRAQSCAIPSSDAGYWTRPFGSFTEMDGGPTQLANAEIAHAVVLPSATDDRDQIRVLLICRTNCASVYPTESQASACNRSFVWYPQEDPGAVTALAGPSFGYTGTSDPFCSGHAVGADGSVLMVGGLNSPEHCFNTASCIQIGSSGGDDNLPVGHRRVYRLDTSVDPPTWVTDETWPAATVREHWYPAVVVLHDGTIFIAGHGGAPSNLLADGCPVPDWPYVETAPFTLDQVFEILDPVAGIVGDAHNLSLIGGSEACGLPAEPLRAGVYPRLHLLSTGKLLHGNASGYTGHPGPSSRLMNFKTPPCPGSLRWEFATSNPAHHRDGGNSIHLVVRDASVPAGIRDFVYAIGGIQFGDEDPCEGAGPIWSTVQRFNGVSEQWESRAALPSGRVNANTVILPTGALLTIGGTNAIGNVCEPDFTTLEYFPTEVFGATLGDQWFVRADLGCPREYHSVAGLLPDGRVFVGGGVSGACTGGKNAMHTVEIHSPGYYFSGQRPQITDWPDPYPPEGQEITNGEVFPDPIDVSLSCDPSNTVKRVVLIRSGSATHAFDMNQRYVELAFTPLAGSAHPNFSLTVQAPVDGYSAPPGYYLLFVVDANDLPSAGRWVKVVNPTTP
ncbi:MAG TPA: galactose oxidase early set domain-containing protein [Planctomycetota bacterium]|nr:galactose oxidase early set domain-containing protein [Planctomycetota bacterium]